MPFLLESATSGACEDSTAGPAHVASVPVEGFAHGVHKGVRSSDLTPRSIRSPARRNAGSGQET
jgi:hypothetical protein